MPSPEWPLSSGTRRRYPHRPRRACCFLSAPGGLHDRRRSHRAHHARGQEADPRGIAHSEKRYPDSRLRSFGVGLTKLRKLAKKVGRDHELALKRWQSDVYEARVVGLLIDQPERITRAQAEELGEGQLANVFSSCDASLAKVPFAQNLADDWVKSEDPARRSCGYGLANKLSRE